MNRRFLFLGIGGAIGFLSHSRVAKSSTQTHRIGLLAFRGVGANGPFSGGLVRGLAKRGYEADRDYTLIAVETQSRPEPIARIVDALVASNIELIVAIGFPAAFAAKQETALPVLIAFAGDPMGTGLVESLARPDGHVTGISDASVEVTPKRIQLLKEMVPSLRRLAVLWNAADPGMTSRYRASEAGAEAMGISVLPLGVREPGDFDQAFARMSGDMPDGLLMVTDVLTDAHRTSLYAFAGMHRLPTMYENDNYVHEGGLMAYGPDLGESLDRVAGLVDRIFKGAKPSELPFQQPSLFRFIINVGTAKALGLTVPPVVLALADEVIE